MKAKANIPERVRRNNETPKTRALRVLDKIIAQGNRIPDHVLKRLPKDLAENHDYYLYGMNRRV